MEKKAESSCWEGKSRLVGVKRAGWNGANGKTEE